MTDRALGCVRTCGGLLLACVGWRRCVGTHVKTSGQRVRAHVVVLESISMVIW